jgi:cytoskeletal protein CcmA (bactofilin family)
MPLYITKNGETFGPHEAAEIAVFLRDGAFVPDDLCWQEGWAEWQPLRSLPAPETVAPPKPKGEIPDDIEIIGTLKLPDDRTVTCRVEGEILSPATVIIAPEAKVKARIKAASVVIFGTVEGDIHASGRAELKSSSTLHGDIHAARVLVEEGATFHGKSHVHSSAPAGEPAKS